MPGTNKATIFQAQSIDQVRQWHAEQITSKHANLLGFVPTMGNLHEGHGSLISEAKKQCQKVAVSIFVNPMQFGPQEDFEKYPRTLQQDLDLCARLGADLVFTPSTTEIYGPYGNNLEYSSYVDVPDELTNKLCGAYRPGHFRGVATVVSKLFNIVQAHKAFFGEKDFQQLLVIKRLAKDLNFPVEVIGLPTVRESDGLALSSRNQYLGNEQRALAPALYRGLKHLKELVREKNESINNSIAIVTKELNSTAGLSLQYLEACHPETLEVISGHEGKASQYPEIVFLVAAKLQDVRLIDNLKA